METQNIIPKTSTEGICVSLDRNTTVSVWREQIIKPNIIKQVNMTTLEKWRWSGRVALSIALANWKWNQENKGKTFSDSIWVVGEYWIFPKTYDVPQNWQNSSSF